MISVFERALIIVFLTFGIIAFMCFIYMTLQLQIAMAEIGNSIEQLRTQWGG